MWTQQGHSCPSAPEEQQFLQTAGYYLHTKTQKTSLLPTQSAFLHSKSWFGCRNVVVWAYFSTTHKKTPLRTTKDLSYCFHPSPTRYRHQPAPQTSTKALLSSKQCFRAVKITSFNSACLSYKSFDQDLLRFPCLSCHQPWSYKYSVVPKDSQSGCCS